MSFVVVPTIHPNNFFASSALPLTNFWLHSGIKLSYFFEDLMTKFLHLSSPVNMILKLGAKLRRLVAAYDLRPIIYGA